MKYQNGDKVVPFQKTTWGVLDESAVWNEAKRLNQPYVYVVGYDDEEEAYMLNIDHEESGDFFKEEDLKPYSKEDVLTYHLKEIEKLGYFINFYKNGDSYSIINIQSPLTIKLDSTTDMPSYGDLMELEEFIDMCDCGGLIDYDGHGDIVLNGKVIYEGIYPSDLEVYQGQLENLQKELGKIQIMWYNR